MRLIGERLPFGSIFSYEYLKNRDQQLHVGPGIAAEMEEIASLVPSCSNFIEINKKRFADSPSFIGGVARRHKISH